MVINNLCAVQSQKYMKTNEKKKKESVEKLSSGYKINKAADDAAGLAISEDMRRQVRGLNRASLNSQEGISAMQIADGAMEEVHEMLRRGLELCIQSANGTNSTSDRESLQQEIDEIKTEIDAIADRTYYSELQVLKGRDDENVKPAFHKGQGLVYRGGLPAWVGIGGTVKQDQYMTDTYQTTHSYTQTIIDASGNAVTTNGTAQINYAAASLDFSGFNGSAAQMKELNGNGFHFTCCTCDRHYSIKFTNQSDSSVEMSGKHYIYNVGLQGATSASDIIDRIIKATDNGNPTGHYTNLAKDGDKLVVYDDRSSDRNTLAGSVTWSDWNNPSFMTRPNTNRGLGRFGEGVAVVDVDRMEMPSSGGGLSVAIQAGSETQEMIPLQLPNLSCNRLGISELSVRTADDALIGIDLIKNASSYISAERSRCGAYQNRMEHNINNVENTAENVTASESRIRDADMVKESMKFSKSNLLAQAGQAILAQANQSYRGVINLLTF